MKLSGLEFGFIVLPEIEFIMMTLEGDIIIGASLVELKQTASVGTQKHLEHNYY